MKKTPIILYERERKHSNNIIFTFSGNKLANNTKGKVLYDERSSTR